jgi:glycosyltransferase involved in cell wall biosynthesis
MSQYVLFAHQSAELYGSDRVLMNLVCGLDAGAYHPIVLLPSEGPLASALRDAGIETHAIELLKVSRANFHPSRLLQWPGLVAQSIRAIDAVLAGRRPSAVYTNTVAVLGGAAWACWRRVPHVWHVHEIVRHPKLASWGLTRLVNAMADAVVCNSFQTMAWLTANRRGLKKKTRVVWNGLARRPAPRAADAQSVRDRAGAGPQDVLVTLVGRINAWKGQGLLIQAANLLVAEGHTHLRFALVGGPAPGPAGQQVLTDMLADVASAVARPYITWVDFIDDVWPTWDGTDIAVIPSTLPEPFGMVAIEAMAAGKPVVAARHGGLVEIVDDQVTGLLVEPNSARALADAISRLAGSAELRQRLGAAGLKRQHEVFSLAAQVAGIVAVLKALAPSPR